MTRETLQAKIEKRADEKAAEAIKKFKKDIRSAVGVLMHGSDYALVGSQSVQKSEADALGAYLTGDNKWPASVWERFREETEKEVLNTMDSLQRMLASKGGGEEFEPIETEEK